MNRRSIRLGVENGDSMHWGRPSEYLLRLARGQRQNPVARRVRDREGIVTNRLELIKHDRFADRQAELPGAWNEFAFGP